MAQEFYPRTTKGLLYLRLIALIDPPRPAARSAIAKCKTSGVEVIMVYGDE